MTMQLSQRWAAKTPPGLSLLVQIVESDPEVAKLHRAALEHAGAVVHASTSAREALDVARTIDIDVLVCETQLEDLDGFTLLRTLKRLRPDLARLPAIALARSGREEDISEALHAGFHIHAVLPIAPGDLVAAVTAIAPSGATSIQPRSFTGRISH